LKKCPYYPYFGYTYNCMHIPVTFPPQSQPKQPGLEWMLKPRPISENPDYKGTGKLKDKVAIITGGDSGIGRAVAYAFADEGADIAIVFYDELRDAEETKKVIESKGRRCLAIAGDIKDSKFCRRVVDETIKEFGKLNILVNNAAVQYAQNSITQISDEQMETTFRTNIFSFFYFTKAALPHMECGDTIINTTSVTAYQGEKTLIDYSSTKGAITSFTRSLALSLVKSGIRVNAIAPGPIWTPLNPASYGPEVIARFGLNTPMRRAGQPFELAPAYVYLASEDSSYVTGQTLHINGGVIVNG
jgi:NAD(P)-dependent dehydrogenase (short-subunit alcohol dehydrogenase family)